MLWPVFWMPCKRSEWALVALLWHILWVPQPKKHLWRSSFQIRRPPTLTLFTFTSRSLFLTQKPNTTAPHFCLWRAVLITSPARSACSERALPAVMNVRSCWGIFQRHNQHDTWFLPAVITVTYTQCRLKCGWRFVVLLMLSWCRKGQTVSGGGLNIYFTLQQVSFK